MPGGPLVARILAAVTTTLAMSGGVALAGSGRSNEARWANVRLMVQVKQAVHWDAPPGGACELGVRPSVSRALTISGRATLRVARDGSGSTELNAAQLSGTARVGSALPHMPNAGCTPAQVAAVAPDACGTYPVNLAPRVRTARLNRADGAKLQVEISVPRPNGRDGTCAGEPIPEGIRAERPSATNNPFTVIGELPLESMVENDGSGTLKSLTATMVRNERTALVDASGHRVGQLRLLQRVILTFRP
jgi:hypothetical protein